MYKYNIIFNVKWAFIFLMASVNVTVPVNSDSSQFTALPDRSTLSVTGSIATMIVDRLYDIANGGLPSLTMNYHCDGQGIVTGSFYYLPVDILKDIDEQEIFEVVYEKLDSLWPIPSDQEYKYGLNCMQTASNIMIEQLAAPDKKGVALEQSEKLIRLLNELHNLSDTDFLRLLLDLLVENSSHYSPSQLYPSLAVYQTQEAVDAQEKIKSYALGLFDNLSNGPCLVSVSFVSNAVDLIKDLGINPSTLVSLLPQFLAIVPEMQLFLAQKEFISAIEIVIPVVFIKLCKAVLQCNLGKNFAAYHAKREKEVDYIILSKIVKDAGITHELLQEGPVDIQLDENTQCHIELVAESFTNRPMLSIECTVSCK